MSITAGIDIGSATAKAVLLRDGDVLGFSVLPTGVGRKSLATDVLASAAKIANVEVSDIQKVVATGYG